MESHPGSARSTRDRDRPGGPGGCALPCELAYFHDLNNHLSLRTFAVEIQDRLSSSSLNVCLLYTSPSPRDRQKSRMPSSA